MQESSPYKYKVLCCVNHFYGHNPQFIGKSSTQAAEVRKQIIEKCLLQLQEIESMDIKICGIEGYSLLPIDINFPDIKNTPTLLIYESINYMVQYLDQYDYFINIEDDILLPKETFVNITQFDKVSLVNEILHPNRLEVDAKGNNYCVDLSAFGYWSFQRKFFLNKELRVNINPHSGIMILSQAKFRYAISNIDLSFRGIILAKEMESAFAHFHSPFSLYRPFENIGFHYIMHLDKWISQSSSKISDKKKANKHKVNFKDFIPPILLMIPKYIKNL